MTNDQSHEPDHSHDDRHRRPSGTRPEPPPIPPRRGRSPGPARVRIARCRRAPVAAAAGDGQLPATADGCAAADGLRLRPQRRRSRLLVAEGGRKDFELNQTMQPLGKVKHQIQILGGLDHINATAGPDGPGDHARASGTFLTGVRVKKTAGADIHAGVSIDQVAAQRIGHLTRFPSLELTCDAVRKSGNCDSGYSCAYQYNLSWSAPTMPVPPEPNPRLVFERLFGAGSPASARKNLEPPPEQQRSILDFVLDDARDLQTRSSAAATSRSSTNT